MPNIDPETGLEPKEELENSLWRRLVRKFEARNSAQKQEAESKPVVGSTGSAIDKELTDIRRLKGRADGGVEHNALESIKPGTLTSLGTMVAPGYGTAAGAVADVGLAVYNENRKVKRENRAAKEDAAIRGWNQMSKAAHKRGLMEQRALGNLMQVGS